MTAEERARTLTGRHQISDDGRHLVDGVPFGRPYLRNPKRPAVRIPPRKRQRLIEIDEDAELAALIANTTGPPYSSEIGLLTNGDSSAGSERRSRASTATRKVHFKGPELEDEDDSEEDDDDFAPGGEQEKGVVLDDDEESEDDSDFSSDSDSDSSSASGTASSDSDSDDISSDSDSDASSPPEVRSSKGVLEPTNKKIPSSPKQVTPGEGRSATRARNSRRTRTNRLRHLKNAGKLPADAGLKALEEYEAAQSSKPSHDSDASRPFSTFAGKRKRIDGDEVEDADTQGAAELEQRKKELMAKFGEDENLTAVPDNESPLQSAVSSTPASPQAIMVEEPPAKKETPKKRLRPDTSAISRILARQAMVSGILI
jgi:hypothetical protein